MKQQSIKRKPFPPKTPRQQVSIFKYQLFPDGKYYKVFLSDEEVLQLFGGQCSELSNVVNKRVQTRGLSQ